MIQFVYICIIAFVWENATKWLFIVCFYLLKSLEVFDVFFIVSKLLRCFPSYFPLFKHNVENQFSQVYGKQTNDNAAAGIKSDIGEVAEAEEG